MAVLGTRYPQGTHHRITLAGWDLEVGIRRGLGGAGLAARNPDHESR